MADSDAGDSGRDIVEVNVGFENDEGRELTLDAAVDVVRELQSLDILTVRIPSEKWDELADHSEIRYVEANGQAGALDG